MTNRSRHADGSQGMRGLKRAGLWRLALLVTAALVLGGLVWRFTSRLERVAAAPQAGFSSDYWLYEPRSLAGSSGPLHLLVTTNNTGSCDDDPERHARAALFRTYQARAMAEELATPLLVTC